MPSKKKKYNARFPPARIKKIMQTDDEVGKVAAAVPVIISRALELFVETLVKNSSEITKARNAKTLTTSHLKACILSDGHFHFLKDLVDTVPDVQGDEDPGTPLPSEGQPALVPRLSRGQKSKNRNGESTAGPSHSTADESDTASDDEEDGDGDSEDSETTCTSDNNQASTVVDARNPRSQGMNFIPANEVPVQFSTASSNANNREDDDYDS